MPALSLSILRGVFDFYFFLNKLRTCKIHSIPSEKKQFLMLLSSTIFNFIEFFIGISIRNDARLRVWYVGCRMWMGCVARRTFGDRLSLPNSTLVYKEKLDSLQISSKLYSVFRSSKSIKPIQTKQQWHSK